MKHYFSIRKCTALKSLFKRPLDICSTQIYFDKYLNFMYPTFTSDIKFDFKYSFLVVKVCGGGFKENQSSYKTQHTTTLYNIHDEDKDLSIGICFSPFDL